MTCFAALLIVCIFIFSCERSPVEQLEENYGWDQDNIFEEIVEELIENELGVEIDLSPESPEN